MENKLGGGSAGAVFVAACGSYSGTQSAPCPVHSWACGCGQRGLAGVACPFPSSLRHRVSLLPVEAIVIRPGGVPDEGLEN